MGSITSEDGSRNSSSGSGHSGNASSTSAASHPDGVAASLTGAVRGEPGKAAAGGAAQGEDQEGRNKDELGVLEARKKVMVSLKSLGTFSPKSPFTEIGETLKS